MFNMQSVFELILLAAVWGGAFICLRISAPEFGTFGVIFLRVSIACLILAPVAVIKKNVSMNSKELGKIFLMGMLMSAIPFTLFAYSSKTLQAGTMVILNATSPIWAAAIAFLFDRTKINRYQFTGFMSGLIGVSIITLHGVEFNMPGPVLVGVFCSLLAACCYGLGSHLGKKYLFNISPLSMAFGSLFSASLVLLPLALFFSPIHMPSLNAWLSVFILGSICTALASLLFFRLTKRIGGQRAITVTYLQPLFGIFWGWALLNEHLNLWTLLGGSIILIGTALCIGLIKPSPSKA